MKKPMLVLMGILLMLTLSGCGQTSSSAEISDTHASEQEAPESVSADKSEPLPPEAGLDREETTLLGLFVEGEWEALSATLYRGSGYSIYIPDGGWRLESDRDQPDDPDDPTTEDTWESILNDDVELTVSRYVGQSAQEARNWFIQDRDYVFEDLLGGELGDPLTGYEADGDCLSLMAVESGGTAYVISWKYPAEAAEGFGARLYQMAETFQVLEP